MSLMLVLFAAGLSADPRLALSNALDAAEPPPSLRAAFRASLKSEHGVRQIEYDPLKPQGERFQELMRWGDDPELDRIVDDWAAEKQPDVRLFADDLRESLGRGRIVRDGETYRVDFQHKASANDGVLDVAVSRKLAGHLTLDPVTGAMAQLEYRLISPFDAAEGARVTDFTQTYMFGKSEQWGVSFVTGYDLAAKGGRFGFSDSRAFSVRITDVAFTLAVDSGQQLKSKPYRPANQRFQMAGAGNLGESP